MATLKALTHAAKQTCMATGVHATHTDPCSISMHMQRRATAIAQALSISLSCSTHGRFAWVPIGTQDPVSIRRRKPTDPTHTKHDSTAKHPFRRHKARGTSDNTSCCSQMHKRGKWTSRRLPEAAFLRLSEGSVRRLSQPRLAEMARSPRPSHERPRSTRSGEPATRKTTR